MDDTPYDGDLPPDFNPRPLVMTGKRLVHKRTLEIPPLTHLTPQAMRREIAHMYVRRYFDHFLEHLDDAIVKDAATAELNMVVLIRPDLLGVPPTDQPDEDDPPPGVPKSEG